MIDFKKRRYKDGVGELAPKLTLPPSFQKEMRMRLAAIEDAADKENVEIFRREAVGIVRGLELAQALEAQRLEQLYILIEDAASARFVELERNGSGII